MNELQDKTYSSNVKDELIAIERGFWEKGNDRSYFRDNLMDSALAIMGPGVMSKSQAMEMTGEAQPWTDFQFNDIRIMPLCADCVALIYNAEGSRPDNNEPYNARISSIYLRRDGNWMLALHQQTPMPGPKSLPQD